MNKKEIKRLLRQEIESHVPQDAPKMNWDVIRVERAKESETSEYRKPIFGHFRLALSFVFTLMISVSLYMLFYQSNVLPTPNPSGIEVFQEEQEVLPLSFLSTAALLPTQNNLSTSTVKLISETTSPVDPIKPFLGLIETIFSQSTGPIVEAVPSDLEAYETLVILHTYDLLGLPITYKMYYNVVSYEDDEDESTFEIEGLMQSSHMTYPMTGKKEIEDGEEKITVRGIIDQNSYIETIYEIEENESKYIIHHVQNNQMIYESVLKVETEADEIKVEMEIESDSEKSSYQMEYEFEDGKGVVKIAFETYSYITQIESSGEIEVHVIIDNISQLSNYQFLVKTEEGEYSEDYERDMKHDDDDDDDEDDEDEEDDEEKDDEDQEDEEDEQDDEE
ncbi:MAG: hypothetical protein RBQ71_05035 [Acholeplasmataceae bacterium]|jgi:hypothetical protein|nr:hypothetical protein [Acholeplasmataceae bacterium]